MSIVMSDGQHNIKFPINEPATGKGGKSQIQEYIDFTARPELSISLFFVETSEAPSHN